MYVLRNRTSTTCEFRQLQVVKGVSMPIRTVAPGETAVLRWDATSPREIVLRPCNIGEVSTLRCSS